MSLPSPEEQTIVRWIPGALKAQLAKLKHFPPALVAALLGSKGVAATEDTVVAWSEGRADVSLAQARVLAATVNMPLAELVEVPKGAPAVAPAPPSVTPAPVEAAQAGAATPVAPAPPRAAQAARRTLNSRLLDPGLDLVAKQDGLSLVEAVFLAETASFVVDRLAAAGVVEACDSEGFYRAVVPLSRHLLQAADRAGVPPDEVFPD